MESELKINTLFLALTRPAMTMGVTHEYFICNMFVSMCAFIAANNIFYGLVWLPIHIAGVFFHRLDHQFVKVRIVSARVPATQNDSLWGVKSYGPY